MDPISRYTSDWERVGWYSLFTISKRADLLSLTGILDAGSVDPYLEVRTAYRQQRWYDIHDGDLPDADFSDDELFSD
jgi:ABC-type transporter lipoprotein component MlaA